MDQLIMLMSLAWCRNLGEIDGKPLENEIHDSGVQTGFQMKSQSFPGTKGFGFHDIECTYMFRKCSFG